MAEHKTDSEPVALRKRSRWRISLWQIGLILLVVIVLVGAFLYYTQRETLRGLLGRAHSPGGTPGVANLILPAGFHSEVFADNLGSPRMIAFSPAGILFVADRYKGQIVALSDPQHTGKATERRVVVSGLSDPTSLDFYRNMLYVGESSRVSRFTLDADNTVTKREVVVPDLPTGGNHTTRTVLIGPDDRLYVSIGSTCNVCNEKDPHRAVIMVYNLDGTDGRVYAKGLRNAVGMAVNPWLHQIWVTNNGRDYLGDNSPPETVYALKDGGDYGWPRCHAGEIVDPDFGGTQGCNGVISPLIKMQAHSAPLGLAFYQSTQFPAQYRGLFIAFHGSWNRSQSVGYKVIYIPLNASGGISTGEIHDFALGWLTDNDTRLGRPVGLAVGPDGALYVSDDAAGLIYRIYYQK